MIFRLEVNLDNAAFQDDPAELARILRAVADEGVGYVHGPPGEPFPIRDASGNRCGSYRWIENDVVGNPLPEDS